MKKLLFFAIVAMAIFSSCKKDIPGCWSCTDSLGNNIDYACGTSEQNAYDNSDIKTSGESIDFFRQHCVKQ